MNFYTCDTLTTFEAARILAAQGFAAEPCHKSVTSVEKVNTTPSFLSNFNELKDEMAAPAGPPDGPLTAQLDRLFTRDNKHLPHCRMTVDDSKCSYVTPKSVTVTRNFCVKSRRAVMTKSGTEPGGTHGR